MDKKTLFILFFIFVVSLSIAFLAERFSIKKESISPKDNRLEQAQIRIDSLEIKILKNEKDFQEFKSKIKANQQQTRQIKKRRNEKVSSVDSLSRNELFNLFASFDRAKN